MLTWFKFSANFCKGSKFAYFHNFGTRIDELQIANFCNLLCTDSPFLLEKLDMKWYSHVSYLQIRTPPPPKKKKKKKKNNE